MALRKTVEIGQKVVEKITTGQNPAFVVATGTVIWIHPKGRFYRVKFVQPGGTCIESYPLMRTKGD